MVVTCLMLIGYCHVLDADWSVPCDIHVLNSDWLSLFTFLIGKCITFLIGMRTHLPNWDRVLIFPNWDKVIIFPNWDVCLYLPNWDMLPPS